MPRLYKSTKRDLLILFSELDEMMTSLLRKTFKTFQQRISQMKKKDQPGKKDSGQLFGHFEESGLWCVCAYVTLSQ